MRADSKMKLYETCVIPFYYDLCSRNQSRQKNCKKEARNNGNEDIPGRMEDYTRICNEEIGQRCKI